MLLPTLVSRCGTLKVHQIAEDEETKAEVTEVVEEATANVQVETPSLTGSEREEDLDSSSSSDDDEIYQLPFTRPHVYRPRPSSSLSCSQRKISATESRPLSGPPRSHSQPQPQQRESHVRVFTEERSEAVSPQGIPPKDSLPLPRTKLRLPPQTRDEGGEEEKKQKEVEVEEEEQSRDSEEKKGSNEESLLSPPLRRSPPPVLRRSPPLSASSQPITPRRADRSILPSSQPSPPSSTKRISDRDNDGPRTENQQGQRQSSAASSPSSVEAVMDVRGVGGVGGAEGEVVITKRSSLSGRRVSGQKKEEERTSDSVPHPPLRAETEKKRPHFSDYLKEFQEKDRRGRKERAETQDNEVKEGRDEKEGVESQHSVPSSTLSARASTSLSTLRRRVQKGERQEKKEEAKSARGGGGEKESSIDQSNRPGLRFPSTPAVPLTPTPLAGLSHSTKQRSTLSPSSIQFVRGRSVRGGRTGNSSVTPPAIPRVKPHFSQFMNGGGCTTSPPATALPAGVTAKVLSISSSFSALLEKGKKEQQERIGRWKKEKKEREEAAVVVRPSIKRSRREEEEEVQAEKKESRPVRRVRLSEPVKGGEGRGTLSEIPSTFPSSVSTSTLVPFPRFSGSPSPRLLPRPPLPPTPKKRKPHFTDFM